MSSRKTTVEIDEELFEEARRILGTDTLKDTVEGAFLEVVRDAARRREVEALGAMEGMELDDPEVMEGAWRE